MRVLEILYRVALTRGVLHLFGGEKMQHTTRGSITLRAGFDQRTFARGFTLERCER